MKPLNVLALYRVRLRARFLQECLAMIGIAAGVALLFASQLSSSSLQSSIAGLSRGIAGNATLQLQARDPHGFPQTLLQRVRELPGVRAAAPVLEASANAVGPKGSEAVELIEPIRACLRSAARLRITPRCTHLGESVPLCCRQRSSGTSG